MPLVRRPTTGGPACAAAWQRGRSLVQVRLPPPLATISYSAGCGHANHTCVAAANASQPVWRFEAARLAELVARRHRRHGAGGTGYSSSLGHDDDRRAGLGREAEGRVATNCNGLHGLPAQDTFEMSSTTPMDSMPRACLAAAAGPLSLRACAGSLLHASAVPVRQQRRHVGGQAGCRMRAEYERELKQRSRSCVRAEMRRAAVAGRLQTSEDRSSAMSEDVRWATLPAAAAGRHSVWVARLRPAHAPRYSRAVDGWRSRLRWARCNIGPLAHVALESARASSLFTTQAGRRRRREQAGGLAGMQASKQSRQANSSQPAEGRGSKNTMIQDTPHPATHGAIPKQGDRLMCARPGAAISSSSAIAPGSSARPPALRQQRQGAQRARAGRCCGGAGEDQISFARGHIAVAVRLHYWAQAGRRRARGRRAAMVDGVASGMLAGARGKLHARSMASSAGELPRWRAPLEGCCGRARRCAG